MDNTIHGCLNSEDPELLASCAHPCPLRDRDVREVLGQLVLLAVAAPGSAAERYPDGNICRTRAGLPSMPIPDDLAVLLREAGVALRP
ncbi:DUF3703 domain-containing protein [Streptomyces fungicidicus]|uniref:DUF3703 domain-containing protein n=1 Tax=Streptomyces fungicidicus TaxID=68203 RepID=UPI00380DAC6A